MLQIFRRMGDGEEDDLDYGSRLSKQSRQVATRGIFDNKGTDYELFVVLIE